MTGMGGWSIGSMLDELRPMPDRLAGTLRITAAVVLVVTVMMSFPNKLINFGALMVFICMQRSTLMTTMVTLLVIPALALTSLMITGVAMVAWNIAWLRILLMAGMFWGGYWFMNRLPALGVTAIIPLAVLSVLIFDFDQYPYPNQIVSQLGWIWAAFGLALLGTVFIQRIANAPSGISVLRDDVRRLLGAAEEACLGRVRGGMTGFSSRIARTMARDGGEVMMSLHRLGKAKLLSKSQSENCRAVIEGAVAVSQAAREEKKSLPPEEWRMIASRLRRLRLGTLRGRPVASPGEVPAARGVSSLALPQLDDAERAVGLTPASPEFFKRLEVPFPQQEFGNIEFASRATLATMSCYFIASLLDWSGIHTCMITCVVTALSRMEAQSARQFQRLLGASLGGLLTLIAMIWLIPATNDLTGVLLILAGGTAICAWCASGREKVSYVGMQMGVAFYLTVLQDPHATTNLDPLRDRLVGIYLGILAMRFFFSIPLPWHLASRPALKTAKA